MPQPDVKANIISGPLANVSIQYRNAEFIGDRVFPILDTRDPKFKITKYRKGAWFRDEAALRAAGTQAKRSGFEVTTTSVSTDEYAFAKEVTDEDRRFSNSLGSLAISPEQDAVQFCANAIDLSKERRISSIIRSATWVDGNSGGEDADGKWVASSGNTFFTDIATGKKDILKNSGILPNVLLIDYATFLGLKEISDVTDKIKYTSRESVTPQLLAAMLELDEVLVGKAIYSTAEETKAGDDFTAANIWETNANKGMGFLFYRPPSIGPRMLTAGLQVRVAQDNGQARRLTSWYEAAEHQTVYEAAEETDLQQICSEVGYLWVDTYAT